MATARSLPQAYEGPQCPLCNARLTADWIRSGIVACPDCRRSFESTAFHPPQRATQIVELVGTRPEEGGACVNHARNAAAASCQRCGVFICTLCEVTVERITLCPSCFDRMTDEGTLEEAQTRFRDFGSLARSAALVGLLLTAMFLGIPAGILAIYYASKGLKQRRAMGDSTAGIWVAIVLAVFDFLLSVVYIAAIVTRK